MCRWSSLQVESRRPATAPAYLTPKSSKYTIDPGLMHVFPTTAIVVKRQLVPSLTARSSKLSPWPWPLRSIRSSINAERSCTLQTNMRPAASFCEGPKILPQRKPRRRYRARIIARGSRQPSAARGGRGSIVRLRLPFSLPSRPLFLLSCTFGVEISVYQCVADLRSRNYRSPKNAKFAHAPSHHRHPQYLSSHTP